MSKKNEIKENKSSSVSFFPRIIREFEDHDEPMIYGGQN